MSREREKVINYIATKILGELQGKYIICEKVAEAAYKAMIEVDEGKHKQENI